MPKVVFSHGQESGPWGTKIRAMAAAVKTIDCEAESVDYQGIADPTERVDKLIDTYRGDTHRLVLVGSSMGGHVATAAATELDAIGIFVLAPAYYVAEFERLTPKPPSIPTEIVHGWHDEVVPVDNSIRFARLCAATLHIVDGGHRLTDNIDDINDYLLRFINKIV